MSIQAELQKLAPDTLIELFELDLTPFGGQMQYFHSGVNELGQELVFNGNAYTPWPMQASGFKKSAKGLQGRPKLVMANVTGLITGLANDYQDMIGASITRRVTFRKYLDAVNFPGSVNPNANPEAHISVEKYSIERKPSEDDVMVEFELSSPLDLPNVSIPGRVVVTNICRSIYRGGECGYAGPAVADSTDQPTTDLAVDSCSQHLSGCKLRFGEHNPLPFGGFPATNIIAIG